MQSFSCTKSFRDGLVEKKVARSEVRGLISSLRKLVFPANLHDLSVCKRFDRANRTLSAPLTRTRLAHFAFSFLFVFLFNDSVRAVACMLKRAVPHGNPLVSTYSRYPIDRPTYYTSTFFLLPYSPRSSSPVSNYSQLDPRSQSCTRAHARFPIFFFANFVRRNFEPPG